MRFSNFQKTPILNLHIIKYYLEDIQFQKIIHDKVKLHLILGEPL